VLAAIRRRCAASSAARTIDRSSTASAKPTSADHRQLVPALLGGAVFIAAVALLYGATMAPSPREGVQPVEFSDEAYYSVLGADLARTGTESLFSPSGFE